MTFKNTKIYVTQSVWLMIWSGSSWESCPTNAVKGGPYEFISFDQNCSNSVRSFKGGGRYVFFYFLACVTRLTHARSWTRYFLKICVSWRHSAVVRWRRVTERPTRLLITTGSACLHRCPPTSSCLESQGVLRTAGGSCRVYSRGTRFWQMCHLHN